MKKSATEAERRLAAAKAVLTGDAARTGWKGPLPLSEVRCLVRQRPWVCLGAAAAAGFAAGRFPGLRTFMGETFLIAARRAAELRGSLPHRRR